MSKLIYRAYCSDQEKISWSIRPRESVSGWPIGSVEDGQIERLPAYVPLGEGGKRIEKMTDEEEKIVRHMMDHPEAVTGEISLRLGRHTLLSSKSGCTVATIPDEGVTLRWY